MFWRGIDGEGDETEREDDGTVGSASRESPAVVRLCVLFLLMTFWQSTPLRGAHSETLCFIYISSPPTCTPLFHLSPLSLSSAPRPQVAGGRWDLGFQQQRLHSRVTAGSVGEHAHVLPAPAAPGTTTLLTDMGLASLVASLLPNQETGHTAGPISRQSKSRFLLRCRAEPPPTNDSTDWTARSTTSPIR